MEKILLRNIGTPESHTLAVYRSRGGYASWQKVAGNMKPEQLIEEVKASGLRGRGGAGFPTGMKWGFVPKDNPKPKYLVCNADESEPGTFKDRLLIEQDPHAIIEGTLIAARVLQCVGGAVIVSKCAGHPDRRRAPVPARAGTGAPASAACSFAGKRPLRRRWSICPSSGAAFFRSPWAPPS